MLRLKAFNISLAVLMAVYLPLWICCASHASTEAVPDQAPGDNGACCFSSQTRPGDAAEQNAPDHECTCIDHASAAFVIKTAAVSFEPVQPLFDRLPGTLGTVVDPCLLPTVPPADLIDASPPGTGPLLDQFCLFTT